MSKNNSALSFLDILLITLSTMVIKDSMIELFIDTWWELHSTNVTKTVNINQLLIKH
jgi:hypothetical protein